jgi:hypothetical protein
VRIYLKPPQQSRGLQRIESALRRYLPEGWSESGTHTGADLIILWAIGRCGALKGQALDVRVVGKKYAVIQICLRSTQKPNTSDWLELWQYAQVVWSYYDLEQAVNEDYGITNTALPNFYHSPLGADPDIFYPRARVPGSTGRYVILSNGLSRLSESVRECHLAAQQVGLPSAHFGARLNLGVKCYDNLSDNALACLYTASDWVSGLRRKEGFELPCVEGLLCGARPVVFDTPDYRWNYGEHADYIKETDRQGVVDQLVQLFQRGPRRVSEAEIEQAKARYDWATIIGGFYERISQGT